MSHSENTFRGMKKYSKKIVYYGQMEKNVQLLLGKFGAEEHEKYANFILPRPTREIPFQKQYKY